MRTLPMTTFACLLGACSASPPVTSDDGGAPPPDLACPANAHAVDGGCDTALAWRASGGIAPGRDHHATFLAETAAGPFLYVVGGTDHYASYVLADVQRAPIASDGSVGAWQPLGNLPERVAGHAVALVGDRVVIAGGVVAPDAGQWHLTNATWVAQLAADGTLGAWQPATPLPSAREHTALLVQGKTLYLVGGLVGADGTDDVEQSTLRDDGTLAPWAPLAKLPHKLSHHAAALAGGAIWVTGGIVGGPQSGSSVDEVLRAPINGDGTLGAWQIASHLPVTLATHSSTVFEGSLYVLGGIDSDVEFTDAVRRAAIADDGTLGPWLDQTPLPAARGHVLETPVWRGNVYSVAGSVADLTVLGDVVVGSFH